ncbi:MAG TPA: SH3 domain-containing C40 family peptidase [Gemmatimonadaceae bacterium]|nr:SH3 domain-containing C40 family peptidase [Gemmatimonadaceae bacterium]
MPGSLVSLRLVVRSAIAPLHAEARVSSAQTSQRLAGHALEVLEERDGDWLRVRGEDGYEGWVHRGYTRPAPEALGGGGADDRRLSLGCTAGRPDGRRRALPLGAWLEPDETLHEGAVMPGAEMASAFRRDPEAIAGSAATLFDGTSYLWGGVTTWGADCSGFVQTIFWLHGVPLPRDAWQQAELGRDAGTDVRALRPADLLFFSDRPDRRITHVGVALGGGRMGHVALGRGGYACEQLTSAGGDPYVAKLVERFVSARRVV